MRCHWIRQQDTYALKAEEAIMTDRITFKTSVDADRFIKQFSRFDFAREENVVVGNFSNRCLTYADFSNADLSNLDLNGSTLQRADFRGATLHNANLSKTNLIHSILRGANLRDANMRGADVVQSDLSNASLINTDLREAYLIDVIVDNNSIPSIGVEHKGFFDNIYASRVYNNGIQTDWGFHLNNLYGSYIEMSKSVIEKYRAGEYSECLYMLGLRCNAIFSKDSQVK